MSTIVREKVVQAARVLDELGIDCWLTFARGGAEAGDPVLPLILGQDVTWQSALILTRTGESIAIVGKYEDEAVRSTGAWNKVIPYVESIRDPLRETLTRLDPGTIGLNYSLNDTKADGLSHGLFELLKQHLEGTPYPECFISAERVVAELRGRKSPTEIALIRNTIASTDEIFAETEEFARPGVTELEVLRFMHDAIDRRGLVTSWESNMCPVVTTGPGSLVGHGGPSATLQVRRGCVFHLDFGVKREGYASDIQRAWYVPEPGETEPPPDVLRAFLAVRASILAAAAVLRPGVEGWLVDEAARQVLIGSGYDEYQHATGHQVGRAAHDGGGVLGPKWERYGQTPFYKVTPGNVFTLELGVDIEGRGYLGLEEMVLVTDSGLEWLSTPQEKLPLLPA
ncbi:MAG: aminopeptidase P family protein [bacterium]|nr:aminopeptidase P family protein [bacterium]